MRVLLVLDWNRERGGTEAHATWLRDGLRAAGDEVRLLTSSAGTAGDGTADYVAFGTERVAAQALLQIVNPHAVITARRAVREFRPDVVWVNTFVQHLSPAVLEAFGSTPLVLLMSDYKYVCPVGTKLMPDGSLCQVKAGWVCCQAGCVGFPHWVRDQPRYALIRYAGRRASKVLACSRWVQRRVAENGVASEVVPVPVRAPSPGFAGGVHRPRLCSFTAAA